MIPEGLFPRRREDRGNRRPWWSQEKNTPLQPCPSYSVSLLRLSLPSGSPTQTLPSDFRIPHQDRLRLRRATPRPRTFPSVSPALHSPESPLPGPTSPQPPPSASVSRPRASPPLSLDLPPPQPDLIPLSLLPQPGLPSSSQQLPPRSRPPFLSASTRSPDLRSPSASPQPSPQRLASPASPLRSPQPPAPGFGPARPRPRPGREDRAHRRSSNRLSSGCPESAPSCSPAVAPVRPSVRQASRPRLRSVSDPGGEGAGLQPAPPAPPRLTYSRAARAPLQPISSRGDGPELGRGQGQPGEAARGPLGLYQGPRQGGGELPRDVPLVSGEGRQRTLQSPRFGGGCVLGDQKPTL